MSAQAGDRVRKNDRIVHICAAREDAHIVNLLVKHLAGVTVTHDGLIRPGAPFESERRAQLEAAHVILLLVSADYVASAAHEADTALALARHEAKAAQLVPVQCRAYHWEGLGYAHILLLPCDNLPIVVEREPREAALREIAAEVCALLNDPSEVDADCPFPGLGFFDEERAADFCGRETELAEVLTLLAEPRRPLRWLQIDGPSGAGKSSFARAGLIPALRCRGLSNAPRHGPRSWITVAFRPGHDPIAGLAEALVKHAKPPLALTGSLDTITRELRESPSALASILREGRPDGHGVVLVIDQLEEAFTLTHGDEATLKQFDALLAGGIDDQDGPLLLVTTIRSDFVVRMGELPGLEQRLSTGAVRYYLRPMSEIGLRAAMEEPAARAKLVFEVGLVDRIVSDAGSAREALPLVAHVLQSLYAARVSRTMTLSTYEALGGVGGALAKTADATVSNLDDGGRVRARKILLRLVKIGRGSADVRQSATRSEVLDAAGGVEAEAVLLRLSGGRVLGTGGASDGVVRLVAVSGDDDFERVDLVHEALIQRWGTLRQWIDEGRELLSLRDDVEHAAEIWERSEAPEGGLPAGAQLARFRLPERASLKERARRYLSAAEAAEKKARAARLLQRAGAMAALLAVVLVAAAGVLWQARKTREQATKADDERQRADTQTALAQREAATAETRRLLALADVASRKSSPQTQLLLDIAAWQVGSASNVRSLSEITRALGDSVRSMPRQRVLAGHEWNITHAAFSPDGKKIVTTSEDMTARVWSTDGKGATVVLRGHEGWVVHAMFSHSGKQIVTAAMDKTARVWSVDGSSPAIVLSGHEGGVIQAEWSPDDTHVVTASADGTARVWSIDGNGPPIVLRGHEEGVTSARFNSNGARVITASLDKTARVWRSDGNGPPIVLRGHEEGVLGAEFSPDGTHIVTVSGKTARVWRANGHDLPLVLHGHENDITGAVFSAYGDEVITSSYEAVHIWDIESGKQRLGFSNPDEGGILGVAFRKGDARVVTRSGVTARVRWASSDGEPQVLRGHDAAVVSAWLSNDDRQVVTASLDGNARWWSLEPDNEASEPTVLRGRGSGILGVAVTPDAKHILASTRDGLTQVWDAATMDDPAVLAGAERLLTNGVLSPNGKYVVTSPRSKENVVHVWSIDGKGEPVTLRGHEDEVERAAFSADGMRIVTTSKDKTARVWNADGTGEVIVLRGHEGTVTSAAFAPDGTHIITSSEDKTARLWRADGTGDVTVLRGHDETVTSATFSPSGDRLVTASLDETALVWKADGTGAPIRIRSNLEGSFRRAGIRAVAFSPNGRLVAMSCEDDTVRIWSADGTGDPLMLKSNGPQAVAFSPDGRFLVVGTGGGNVQLWAFDGDVLARAACFLAGRNLTRTEWESVFPGQPYHVLCGQWPETVAGQYRYGRRTKPPRVRMGATSVNVRHPWDSLLEPRPVWVEKPFPDIAFTSIPLPVGETRP